MIETVSPAHNIRRFKAHLGSLIREFLKAS